MSKNTFHKVTLTEGQIGVILCSLEAYFKQYENISETEEDIQAIFEELEGTIDKYYEKVELAQSKRPIEEW